ncbi:MAG TPA: SDR family NAD(P)-dependent oxidoreductase, partial [Zoogloea sp.]|nr:SDR family NAD(P)-dependent oxidoreductase [Zoogloea sp.]
MSRSDRFKGKAVIVTGAAQGIGQGVAVQVAAEGGRVLAVDRSPLVEEVVAGIVAAGGTAFAIQADLETFAGARAVAAE